MRAFPKDNEKEKPNKESVIKPEPSKPIDKEKKDKKEKETNATTKRMTTLLSQGTIPADGMITAGGFVAEIDVTNIRKNTLRLGDR